MTTPAPPKLPTVYFDEFPKETQDFLLQDIKRKEWLRCAYCGIQADHVRLKRCAACGNNIPGVRTYYCTRACQKADWRSHKTKCNEKEVIIMERSKIKSEKWFEVAVHSMQQWPRWQIGLSRVATWVFHQATMPAGFSDPRTPSVLVIDCMPQGPKLCHLAPVAFQIKKLPWSFSSPRANGSMEPGPTALGLVELRIKDFQLPLVVNCDNLEVEDIISPFCPQWPWIFAHISLFGESSSSLARQKLLSMVEVVRQFEDHPFFQTFQAPDNLDDGEPWELTRIEDWLKAMQHVIGY